MIDGYIDIDGRVIEGSLTKPYKISLCPRFILAYSLKEDKFIPNEIAMLKSDFIIPTLKLAFQVSRQEIFKVVIYDTKLSTGRDIVSYPVNSDLDLTEFCNTFNITDSDEIRELKKLVMEFELQ